MMNKTVVTGEHTAVWATISKKFEATSSITLRNPADRHSERQKQDENKTTKTLCLAQVTLNSLNSPERPKTA